MLIIITQNIKDFTGSPEIARKSSGEELCFEVIDGTVVKIDDDKSSFQLNCVRGEEYPDVNIPSVRSCLAFERRVSERYCFGVIFKCFKNSFLK